MLVNVQETLVGTAVQEWPAVALARIVLASRKSDSGSGPAGRLSITGPLDEVHVAVSGVKAVTETLTWATASVAGARQAKMRAKWFIVRRPLCGCAH